MMSGTLAERGIHLRDERIGTHRGRCPACATAKHRPRDTALSVTIGDRGTVWCCHRCGWTGFLGDDREHEPRRRRRPPPPEPEPEPDRRAAELAATKLWRASAVITADCPAGVYLAGRGCALPHLEGDVHWVPDHRHPCGWSGPCMVALVTDVLTADPMTLHRTWLLPDGSGKAQVDPPRLYWKGLPKKGGVVRLWPDEEVTMGLLIGEGVETVLCAARGFTPAWACLDKGNLAALQIPIGIDCLTVIADRDPDGGGELASDACRRRWRKAGVQTRKWLAAEVGADFADFVNGKDPA